MLDAEPCFRRDHVHIWIWLRSIRMDAAGNVRWACRKCGHITTRPFGEMPAGTEE
jgi:hypothetical protein